MAKKSKKLKHELVIGVDPAKFRGLSNAEIAARLSTTIVPKITKKLSAGIRPKGFECINWMYRF